MFAASAATKAAKMALAAKDDSHLVVPEKHPAPKTYDVWRKKSDLISARRRDARSKSDVSEQASHSCFGLINTQQPQSISNDHKRGSRRLMMTRNALLFVFRRRIEGKSASLRLLHAVLRA